MDKLSLSEREICSRIITPKLQQAGWDLQTQIREELTGQTPVAVIEAKRNKFSVGHGMPQALGYSEMFQVPFAFSSNGDGFLFHDKTLTDGSGERELTLDQFPSPADLWHRYCQWRGMSDQSRPIVEFDYHSDGSGKGPRYYQKTAINRTIEAIATGQNRILLVMVTGTGKTYTAFQIIWRLWKSGTKKRILCLADRNMLIDQTMVNDFKPFKGAMAKLSTRSKAIEKDDGTEEEIPTAIRGKKRQVDTSYEIYMSLYQAITGPEERQNIFKSISCDFFDLIIIDECHRGSAAEDSAWRKILDDFSSATHIGLTVIRGKKTKDADAVKRSLSSVPDGWNRRPLSDLCRFIDYRCKTPTRTPNGVRVITAKNVRMGLVENEPVEFVAETQYEQWMTRGFPETGDLLFVTEGHTMGFVGMLGLRFRFALAQRTINLHPFATGFSQFLFYYLMSPQFQADVVRNATGSAAKGIRAAKLKQIPIAVPPLPEQKRNVSKVTDLLSQVTRLESTLTRREATRTRTQLLTAAIHCILNSEGQK